MAATRKEFGKIKVAINDPTYAYDDENREVHLHFTNETVYNSTLRELRLKGYVVVDAFWGYTYYTKVNAALHDIQAMCLTRQQKIALDEINHESAMALLQEEE